MADVATALGACEPGEGVDGSAGVGVQVEPDPPWRADAPPVLREQVAPTYDAMHADS